jgi:Centromere protein B dimerisation domain
VETVTAVDNEDDDDEDDDNDDDDDDDNDDGDYNDDCQVRSQCYSIIFTRRSVSFFLTPTTTHLLHLLLLLYLLILLLLLVLPLSFNSCFERFLTLYCYFSS